MDKIYKIQARKNLIKVGTSIGVTFNKKSLEKLGFVEGDAISVEISKIQYDFDFEKLKKDVENKKSIIIITKENKKYEGEVKFETLEGQQAIFIHDKKQDKSAIIDLSSIKEIK